MALAMKIGTAIVLFAYDSDTARRSAPAHYLHKSYVAQQLCENRFAAAQRAPTFVPVPLSCVASEAARAWASVACCTSRGSRSYTVTVSREEVEIPKPTAVAL
ncbi:hypothetical protein CVT25_011513 [Psilocybe cyanescens]|uniref:Uncharacterized protein n=1 Tax=Psilocybe cyanescens TaxID=93625 RepID=A0A409XUR8_PSICY|nr:hypothetical protein CVT25_011513 [Psilocybe cyanescens]